MITNLISDWWINYFIHWVEKFNCIAERDSGIDDCKLKLITQ